MTKNDTLCGCGHPRWRHQHRGCRACGCNRYIRATEPVHDLSSDDPYQQFVDSIESSPCTDKPDLGWVSSDPHAQRQAAALCGQCPVQGWCLDYVTQVGEVAGVWGGLTEQDRDIYGYPHRGSDISPRPSVVSPSASERSQVFQGGSGSGRASEIPSEEELSR